MSESLKLQWEDIEPRKNGISRAKIPGGWLVRESHSNGFGPITAALCFVPDAKHVWQFEETVHAECGCGEVKSGTHNEIITSGWMLSNWKWYCTKCSRDKPMG